MAAEKRRTARGQVSATVALLDGKRSLGNFRVLNLSLGGALLVGRAPSPRPDEFDVIVRLSTGRVVRAGAVVLREESVEDSSVFAIEFSRMPHEDCAAIDNLVLTTVEDERDPTALIVASAPELKHLLRRHLKGLGHPAFDVGTLEDALRLLDAPNAVSVVLVDLALDPARVAEVLTLLAEKYPRIRRVVIESEASPALPRTLRNGASPADAVVPSPCTRESLARALERQ